MGTRILQAHTIFFYKTYVVYNDTSLLANVSTQNFAGNVSTDGRIPILVVHKSNVSGNETPASFPLPNMPEPPATSTSHHGGQAGLASSLPTTPLLLLAVLLPLLLL